MRSLQFPTAHDMQEVAILRRHLCIIDPGPGQGTRALVEIPVDSAMLTWNASS
jgi:hypothetical protein